MKPNTPWPKMLLNQVSTKSGQVHDLRHMCGQVLLDGGADMSDVQHALGHSNISMTQRVYAPFARNTTLDRARSIMDNALDTGQRQVN